MTERTKPEVMVSIYLTFPNLDRVALGEHLKPVIDAVVKAGGITSNISIQPFDPDEDLDP